MRNKRVSKTILVSNRDLRKNIEHIGQRKRDLRDAIQPASHTRRYTVEPTRSPGAAGSRSVLISTGANELTGFVEELCGHWPGADPCTVSLEHAYNTVDLRWSDASALTCARR